MLKGKERRQAEKEAFARFGGYQVPEAFRRVFGDIELTREQIEAIAKAHRDYYMGAFGVGAKFPKTKFFENLALKMIEEGQIR